MRMAVLMAMSMIWRALQIHRNDKFHVIGILKAQRDENFIAMIECLVQPHKHKVVTPPVQRMFTLRGNNKTFWNLAHTHDASVIFDMAVQLDALCGV